MSDSTRIHHGLRQLKKIMEDENYSFTHEKTLEQGVIYVQS